MKIKHILSRCRLVDLNGLFEMKKIIVFLVFCIQSAVGYAAECDLEFAEACTNEDLLCMLAKTEQLSLENNFRIAGYEKYAKKIGIVCHDIQAEVENSLTLMPLCKADNTNTWDDCVGTEVTESGGKYYGTFKNGKKHGVGKYQYKFGDQKITYYGGISNDKFYGPAVILPSQKQAASKDKDQLIFVQGNFRDGLQGPGLEFYKKPPLTVGNSKIAGFDQVKVGYFKDSQLNGLGYKTYPSAIYFGLMENGLENGSGSLLYDNGENQVGDFKDGSFNGGTNTIHVLPNGYVKIGSYVNGKLNGQGKLVSPTGQEWPVRWQDGDLSYSDKLAIYFRNLPSEYRYAVQKILKKKNLYSSKVDGLWGPGTKAGILQLSQRLGVEYSKPSVVLQTIIENDQIERNKAAQNFSKTGPQRKSRDDTFLLGLFAAMIIIGGGDINDAFAMSDSSGFLVDNYSTGLNRICTYSDGISKSSLTVSAASICPINSTGNYIRSPAVTTGFLKHEYISGMNRNCVYSDGISTSTITISAVSICPISN